jgi:hypothetical protein
LNSPARLQHSAPPHGCFFLFLMQAYLEAAAG